MRLGKILLAGLLLDAAVAAITAGAASVFVGPNACPVAAEALPYVPESDVAAPEFGGRLKVEKSVVILYDAPLSGRRGAGLFARVALDPETGLPFDVETSADCRPEPDAIQ